MLKPSSKKLKLKYLTIQFSFHGVQTIILCFTRVLSKLFQIFKIFPHHQPRHQHQVHQVVQHQIRFHLCALNCLPLIANISMLTFSSTKTSKLKSKCWIQNIFGAGKIGKLMWTVSSSFLTSRFEMTIGHLLISLDSQFYIAKGVNHFERRNLSIYILVSSEPNFLFHRWYSIRLYHLNIGWYTLECNIWF